ncbi:type II toxin-antitoxin system RelB/DinJ family antitoxin [Helcococcus kunzii]|uniref:RelB/DinJ family addiction module antitoxin n=1 Tax=Helcococcus kunzii ATCC 51366 TaxID=883114 RepID=H3NRA4_9FIRM|nr:type II toxin-antitoxin system RelB/DinJ family antitoxin [Helcococcus kunzii]EHR31656.1 RelB/DinJ family addiction module antitoxin [Helcococcus kunzii ATCC 51366]MCT1796887.1 type II toxin-antitoxin system RelB/DinJ family antitoxin [Helcococcus kunzii]MCT1989681.1 type II toxin-antitoxin system RelB/DinJ family antitoxin [Helcococcus kunzii]QZO76245.1 type II toxin-antitoxin system RelB/DinJ family antitoxin [Helcococcus kunzii]
MAKTSSILIKIEPDLKERSETVLNQLGLSMSVAINLFLRQVALQEKIPFELELPRKNGAIDGDKLTEEKLLTLLEERHKTAEDKKRYSLEEVNKKLDKLINEI